ncbi:MAG: YihY/virulence factor BrkB family protein [Chloroflexota bacterium]
MAPWQNIRQGYRWLNERSQGWLGVVGGSFQAAISAESSLTAAAIAYYALFSLFPLALLSISVASLTLDPIAGEHLIVTRLEFVAPALGQLMGEQFEDIVRTRGPVTGVALVGLLWSSSSIFYTLTRALHRIWGIKRGRPYWQGRGRAILFVLGACVLVLFLASFAGSIVGVIRTLLPDRIIQIYGYVSGSLAIGLDVLLFTLLYYLLPHANHTWADILPGAVSAGLLWEAAKRGFLLFIASYVSASNVVYGSVTAVIAFLAWAYLSGLIFLFGAHLNVGLAGRARPGTKAGQT